MNNGLVPNPLFFLVDLYTLYPSAAAASPFTVQETVMDPFLAVDLAVIFNASTLSAAVGAFKPSRVSAFTNVA